MSWKAKLLLLLLAISSMLYIGYTALDAWNDIMIKYPLERKSDGSINLQ